MNSGRSKLALEQYNTVLGSEPRNTQALIYRAIALGQTNRALDDAIRDVGAAIDQLASGGDERQLADV